MPMNQCLYWLTHGFLKGRGSVDAGYDAFSAQILQGSALKLSFAFWLPVSAALYTVVPVKYGILVIDSFGFFWAIVLSYLGARE